jgi:REP element-mobilizing transposase RayT
MLARLLILTTKTCSYFRKYWRNVSQRFTGLCHAYCLMDNHYHLMIETPEGNLSGGMRQLNGIYTQRFNRRHGRVGHVFQGVSKLFWWSAKAICWSYADMSS